MTCSTLRWTRQPSGRNVHRPGCDLADEAAAHEQPVRLGLRVRRRVAQGRQVSCEARAIIRERLVKRRGLLLRVRPDAGTKRSASSRLSGEGSTSGTGGR